MSIENICPPEAAWAGMCSVVQEQFIGFIVAAIMGALFVSFGAVLSLLRPKFWRFAGRWYLYAWGFYPVADGSRPLYAAHVFVVPLPPLVFVFSWNRAYSYVGQISLLSGNVYIRWSGFGHAERMLSIYPEPLKVTKETILLGAKSCITKNNEPAANKELLSRRPLAKDKVEELIGGAGGHIVVKDGAKSTAHYELS